MENGTIVWTLEGLLRAVRETHAQINGRWVPARPMGFTWIRYRIRAAWMVFTGKADAVVWTEGQ